MTRVPALVLADALRQVLPAVGADRKRPQLHGVLFEARDGVLRIVATDAHRLAMRELPLDDAATFRAVVPGTALADLARRLPGDDGSDVDLAELPTLDVEFPDVDRVLAGVVDGRRIVLRRDALLEALERLPDAEFAELRLESGRLALDVDGRIEAVAGTGTTTGGDGLAVKANPALLHDAVAAFDTGDVVLELTSPRTAIVLTGSGGDGLTYLVMPVLAR